MRAQLAAEKARVRARMREIAGLEAEVEMFMLRGDSQPSRGQPIQPSRGQPSQDTFMFSTLPVV